ncbi:hypothetical protein KY312_02050 [Candidatus Woesearchaeota archaeon]|nr:hypothetical protein [Candidatus Woesearchaeota archaeon]
MLDYELVAKVSGKEVDFELKRKVESINVLEKLAGICIEPDSDGLKPVLTPEEAYKYLREGKGYRWFRQNYNCTKQQISGYKQWMKKNPSVAERTTNENNGENSGIDLYAKLTGRGTCIELRGKVASLDSVLQQIVDNHAEVSDPVQEPAEEGNGMPKLSYEEFQKNSGKPNKWFTENYNTTNLQLTGYRLALRRHRKGQNNENSKPKPKLTRDIAVKHLNKGRDYDWLKQRYECSIMQVAGYKSWLNRASRKRKK